jgi:RNA polymerase sigma factor (TIGR02999 family)
LEKRYESMTDYTPFTLLLESARQGDQDASQQLWISVYDEVRRIAQRAVDREFGANSLQATELAHEAFLRLAGNETIDFQSRSHLLATVARAIRRLLVDRARARKAEKRGGQLERVALDEVLDSPTCDLPILLDLDSALTELETVDKRCAELVELRFFSGMTLEQAAEVLSVSIRTAAGDWAFARAWLRRSLEGEKS